MTFSWKFPDNSSSSSTLFHVAIFRHTGPVCFCGWWQRVLTVRYNLHIIEFEKKNLIERSFTVLNSLLGAALSKQDKEYLEKLFLKSQDVIASPKLRNRFLAQCATPTKNVCPRTAILSYKIAKNFFKAGVSQLERVCDYALNFYTYMLSSWGLILIQVLLWNILDWIYISNFINL